MVKFQLRALRCFRLDQFTSRLRLHTNRGTTSLHRSASCSMAERASIIGKIVQPNAAQLSVPFLTRSSTRSFLTQSFTIQSLPLLYVLSTFNLIIVSTLKCNSATIYIYIYRLIRITNYLRQLLHWFIY